MFWFAISKDFWRCLVTISQSPILPFRKDRFNVDLNPFSEGIDFGRQNLMLIDVRM